MNEMECVFAKSRPSEKKSTDQNSCELYLDDETDSQVSLIELTWGCAAVFDKRTTGRDFHLVLIN
jgi:hypothetical protein